MKCRICENGDNNKFFRVLEMQFGTRQEFDYFECGNCGCLQIAKIPADMSPHYPDQYYTVQPLSENKYRGLKGDLRVWPFAASLFPRLPFNWFLSRLIPQKHFACLADLNPKPSWRVLDVGCGNGKHFIYPLRRIGFEKAAGCDPFISAPLTYQNGLNIAKKTILDLNGTACFDLITFHHSFEHIPNPAETLGQVSRLLADNSLCVIRIPTSTSYAWQHYGIHWVQLDAPRHLFLHSVESMRRLAETAGLKVAKIAYDSDYFQFWGSENYQKGIPLCDQKKGKGLAWQYLRWRLNRRAHKLNRQGRGDQAVFVLTNCKFVMDK